MILVIELNSESISLYHLKNKDGESMAKIDSQLDQIKSISQSIDQYDVRTITDLAKNKLYKRLRI